MFISSFEQSSFIRKQKQAINALLIGKDVMVVLPTAFWKRMIYQSFVNAKLSSDSALESDH